MSDIHVNEERAQQIKGNVAAAFGCICQPVAGEDYNSLNPKCPIHRLKNLSISDSKDILHVRPAVEVFDKCIPLLESKAHDYTNAVLDADYHHNFKVSQYMVDLFSSPYQGYAALIGTKLVRLSVLLRREDNPQRESIEDTFADAINYLSLMYERYTIESGNRQT